MNLPQYEINYTGQIPANTTGIVFNPKAIDIAIGNRFFEDANGTPTEVVQVCITLTEKISEDWVNTQVRTLTVPVTFLDCIDGFDKVAMKPSINKTVLAAIFSQFNINLL